MKKGKDTNSNYNLPVESNTYNKRRSGKLVSALSVCLALGLGACSEIPCIYLEGDCTSDNCLDNNCLVHTHSYTKLNYDETSHWYECPEDGEIDLASISEHTYVNTIIDPYYDYELDEAAPGSDIYTCSVCGYSYSKDIENTNIYTKPSSDEEETSLLTQQNLDTIPTDGGTLVLTNGEYSELYLRVSNAVSASDVDGNHTREVNDLTIKGDGETVVDGLVISDDYYDYDENNPQPVSLNVKTLEGDGDEGGLDHTLVINNLVIEDIDFTSSIRISGNVVINGLIVRNCTYTYPSEYRYLSGSKLAMSADTSATVDLSTIGLVYAVNSGDTPWTNIVIDGCSVIEPYYGIYIEGDASVSVTNCYLSSYRFVKYLTSSGATSTGNAAIGTYNELISIKPHGDEGSISSDVSITNNTFQGGHYTKYSSITLSNGSILVDGIGEDGSFTFTGNTAGDTVNKNTVVATFSNITSSNITISDNTYSSPTMGMNFSSTFTEAEEGSNTYQWKVMYADTLYTFDNGSDIEYFCNACWNNGTNLDHADHLNHEHGHTDNPSASKDFDAEWDEVTHAMILANYYSSPYMSFYLDFLDFSKHDYMISFDLDFSSFKAENGEYVSMACCIAHDYSGLDVEVGYSTDVTADGKTGFYVTAKAHNGTDWNTVTHHEEDGKVHIEMNFSKDYNISGNAGGPAYFSVNVYEGDVYHKGALVASVSSSHSSGAGTSCIQWCPDAGHNVDTDHDGNNDHYGYTEDGDYVEIDNFGFTVLENNVTRPSSN